MGLELYKKTKSELVINSDDLSVYGHIKYNDKKYAFQLVYTESGKDEKEIKFDEPTPYEYEWGRLLKNMIIIQNLM